MRLQTAALLTGLALARAGIFHRQCYPETVFTTAIADPVTTTTTCTETSVSTETITSRLHFTVTTTSLLTSLVTVPGPTLTVTETFEGSTPLSSNYTVLVSTTFAKPDSVVQSSAVTCMSSGHCDRWHLPQSVASEQEAATTIETLHEPSTVFVVPLATLPSIYSHADVTLATVVSILQSPSQTTSGASTLPFSVHFATVTVDVTETVLQTSFATIPSVIPPFPTLNITGTQGVNPTGANGTATGITANVSNATAFSLTANNETSKEAHASTTARGVQSVAVSASSPVTGFGGSSVFSIAASATSVLNRTAALSTALASQGLNSTHTSSQQNSSAFRFINPTSSSGNWTFTLGITQSASAGSLTVNVASATALISGKVSLTSEGLAGTSIASLSYSSTVQGMPSLQLGTSSNVVSNAPNTQSASDNSGSRIPVTDASNTSTDALTGVPLQTTPALSTLSFTVTTSPINTNNTRGHAPTPGPFTNSTSIFPSSSRTATGETAGISPRCANEDPFAWKNKEKRNLGPETATLENGEVMTINWDGLLPKRQVGQIVTATIEGHVVTWANNWNGIESTDMSSGAPVLPVSSLVNTPTRSSILLPIVATPAVQTTSLWGLGTSNQLTSSAWQIVDAKSTVSSATTSFRESSRTTAGVASLSSAVTTLEVADLSDTGALPSYTPPGWLTSMFPLEPTTARSTVTTGMSLDVTQGVTQTLLSTSLPMQSVDPVSGSSPNTMCGGPNSGAFTVNFDDLPRNGQPSTTDQYPPLPNPYHKLFWSAGYSYVPPPSDPFPPHSGNQLGIFIVDGNANVHSLNWTGPIPAGDEVNGMVGAGANYQNSDFFFNAIGAWVGCQNSGPDECDIQVNGFGYDDATGQSILQVDQHFYQSPCTELKNCSLEYFAFNEAFHNLTALQIVATHQNDPNKTALTWYIDDLALAWTDNSCDAVHFRNAFI